MHIIRQLLLLLLFLTVFSACADDLCYSVESIKIKEHAKSSMDAKRKALSSSAHKAFQKLMDDLSVTLDGKILKSINVNMIQDCVHDYSIENEKYASSSYAAEISYSFSKKKIHNLLAHKGYNISNLKIENDNKKITIYLSDYIAHFNELRDLNTKIERLSDTICCFKANDSDAEKIKKLRIRYVES